MAHGGRRSGAGRKRERALGADQKQMCFWIPTDLSDALGELGKRNHISRTKQAELLLTAALAYPDDVQAAGHIKMLAHLISRAVRWVENSVGATGSTESDSKLFWHKNAFTHAAVRHVIADVLEWYRPDGPEIAPPAVERLSRDLGSKKEAEAVAIAKFSAHMLRFELAKLHPPQSDKPNTLEYGRDFDDVPKIVTTLGPPKKTKISK